VVSDLALAHVVGGNPYLQIVDVSDSTNPITLGAVDPSGMAYGMSVQGVYAYVSDFNGLRIVDVSDPTSPVDVGYYRLPGRQFGLVVAGDVVYLGGDAGLLLLHVELPGN